MKSKIYDIILSKNLGKENFEKRNHFLQSYAWTLIYINAFKSWSVYYI